MWEVVPVEHDGSVATVFEGVAVLSDDSVVVARRRFGPGHGGSCSVSARAVGWTHGVGFTGPCGLSDGAGLGRAVVGRSGGVAAGAGLGW